MSDSITFKAYFPDLQSAIQFDGSGGIRIKLNIPADQEADALELLTMRGKVMEVTLRPAPDEKQERDW